MPFPPCRLGRPVAGLPRAEIMKAPIPASEEARLASLRSYGILDTPTEQAFEDIVDLAAIICGTPISAISFVDSNRQWFKAIHGLPVTETPRDVAFCAHAILGREALVVPDATADARFADNALVLGDPGIRFYAGAPLVTGEGHALGSLCVIDRVPRELDAQQLWALTALSRRVRHLLENRKETEQLRLLSAIVEGAPDAIYTRTLDEAIITSWNPAAERMFGYTAAEAIGRRVDAIVPPEARADLDRLHKQVQSGGSVRQVETVWIAKDGQRLDTTLSLFPLPTPPGMQDSVAVLQQDITERKRAEAARREAEALLAKLSRQVPGVIYQYRLFPDGRSCFPFASEGLQEIYELSPEQAREDASAVFTRLHPADHDAVVASISASARSLEPWCHEYRVVLPRQGERWRHGHAQPERLADGSVLWHGFITDITRRKQVEAEMERYARELERSNHELGQFAYVASHDLQEPLRMVASYAQLFAERYHAVVDEQGSRYIGYMVEGAQRMQQLVRDLLDYARVDSQGKPLVPIDSAAVLAEVRHDLQAALGECNGVIEHGALPWVRADRGQLRQLLQNLIGNALKFRGSTPPRVRIAAVRADAAWLLSVVDNGIGIEPQYHDRVFQMFQRLHERDRYPGSGIGLTIARKIVERHGGRIWVESVPGAGTTFHFTLPAAEGPPGRTVSPGAAEEVSHGLR